MFQQIFIETLGELRDNEDSERFFIMEISYYYSFNVI